MITPNAGALKAFVLCLATFALLLQPAWATKEKTHVLVIHFYHENLPWSKGLNRGIAEVFDKSGLPVELHAEYLDNIRHLRKDLFPVLSRLYKDKYEKLNIKVIITTDDPALDFVIKYRDSIFPGVPVVFCAPNRLKPERIAGQKNITGVSEDNDVRVELETIMKLMPGVNGIGLISDRAPAGIREINDILSFQKEYREKLDLFLTTNKSLPMLKQEMSGYGDETAFVYMSFLQDAEGNNYSSNLEVIKELSLETQKPLFTFKKIYVGKGAVGGMLVSEELMAMAATGMAVKIISGTSPADIPIVYKPKTLAKFDYQKLVELGIDEKRLPKNHVLINKPFSFYETYKVLVWAVISIVSTLLFIVLVLSVNIIRRKRAEALVLESEAKYRGIFENASEGLFQVDSNWELINVNPKFKTILGFDENEKSLPLLNEIISQAFIDEDEIIEFLGVIQARESLSGFDARLLKRNNTRAWVSIYARAIYDEKSLFLYYEGSVVDVTEKKERERAERERDAVKVASEAKSKYLAVVEAANKKVMDSIQYAKLIQLSLLPDMEEVKNHIPNSFFLWSPRDIVGGDICHAGFFDDGCVVAMIDCTGHGVPGAFMTMVASSGLRRLVNYENLRDPALILKKLNYIVKTTLQQDKDTASSDDGMDAAICFISKNRDTIIFSGARLPLYVVGNQRVEIIKGDKQSVGYKRSKLDFEYTNHEVKVEKGMTFYMSTDGYQDQLGGGKGRPLGRKRFLGSLEKISPMDFDAQMEFLKNVFNDYMGSQERIDDVAVMGFSLDE